MDYQQFYSSQDISRSAELRKTMHAGYNLKRKVIVIWEDRVFFDAERDVHIFLDFSTLPFFLQVSQEFFFLGINENDGEEISCLDVSGLNLNEAEVLVGKGEFMPVREIACLIDRKQAAYMGYAKGISGSITGEK